MIIGSNILYFNELTSTNTEASRLIKDSSPAEGTVIRAEFQSAGRGQKGNNWESEAGKNLLFSAIIYPVFIPAEKQFIISMSVALAVTDFLHLNKIPCSIKWPNDIYINNDKIAGILIENSVMNGNTENSIIGLGININQQSFQSGARNPVSLSKAAGRNFDTDVCFMQLLQQLDKRYKSLIAGKYKETLNEYNSILYRRNEWHRFSSGTLIFEGMIHEAGDNGILTVMMRDGSAGKFAFRELEFII